MQPFVRTRLKKSQHKLWTGEEVMCFSVLAGCLDHPTLDGSFRGTRGLP